MTFRLLYSVFPPNFTDYLGAYSEVRPCVLLLFRASVHVPMIRTQGILWSLGNLRSRQGIAVVTSLTMISGRLVTYYTLCTEYLDPIHSRETCCMCIACHVKRSWRCIESDVVRVLSRTNSSCHKEISQLPQSRQRDAGLCLTGEAYPVPHPLWLAEGGCHPPVDVTIFVV